MTQYPPQTSRSNFFTVVKAEASSTPPISTTNMANSTVAPGKVPGTPGPAGRLSPEGTQVRRQAVQMFLTASICIPHNIFDLISSEQVLSKKKLQDLVREIDPNEQLDEDVEEVGITLVVSDPHKYIFS